MKKNKVLDSDCIFEKKKWISITGLCNNNCMFCLDKDRPDKFHKDSNQIKKEIRQAKEQGNTKLVISGGDPTIHPNIIDFIKYAKKLGYAKIQVVTNGRMFASKTFTDKAIAAGLDEVTFSIHGYNSEMHDSLTRVPGSFRQTLKGVKNLLNSEKSMIINTDTCITKSNYTHLPKIIRFITEKVGIKEVNLMSMVPQGNAWKYKGQILYDYEKVAPYVHEVIDYCIANDVVLWLSRFPAGYLEGYEEFIEDPYKMVDDIRGMGESIYEGKEIPECKNIKCKYCGIKTICDGIIKIKQKFAERKFIKKKNKIISITKTNFKNLLSLSKQNENPIFELVKPNRRLNDYEKVAPQIKQIIPYLESAIKKLSHIRISGIPPCTLIENSDPSLIFNRKISFIEKEPELKQEYIKDGKLDYVRIAKDLTKDVKIKKTSCKNCIFTDTCKGIYRNYVRIYGFKEINPIKQREIRINLECNQSCYFCNTDPCAENVITQEKEIFNQIKKWSYEGVKFLVISGKEPTLDKNLANYISFAKKKGFKKIEVQTNCVSLANKNLVLKLKNAGLTHAFVSLHGHNSKISDKITQAKGSFEKTLIGLNNLLEENINTTINIVINKLNYKNLSSIVELIDKKFKGVDSVVFSFVSPVSDAWKNRWIIPKISEVQPYLFKALDLCNQKKINAIIPSRCGIPLCFLKGYENHSDELRESSRWKNYQDKTFLEPCNECKHRERCSGIWERYIQLYGKSEFIKPKRIEHIEINLGKVCNNKCLFCMVYENKDILNKFVPSKQIKKELKHFRNKNYKSVGFLGGEPTVYPNILEIIRYAKELGYEEIHMVSNGRKFSDMQ